MQIRAIGAGINLKNYQKEVNNTKVISETNPGTKKISLKETEDIKQSVIELTHELTNRINSKKFIKEFEAVADGKIKPGDYAKNVAKIEVYGQINQIKVASDIGYKYGNQDLDNLVDQYCKDPVNVNLKEKVKPGTIHLPEYTNNGVKFKKYGDEIKAYNKKYGTNEKPKI